MGAAASPSSVAITRDSSAQRLAGRAAVVTMGLVALAVRVSVVLLQPMTLANDSADYHRLATSLAHGRGFGTSALAPGGGPTAFRPPLFPLLIGAVYRVVGVRLSAARLVGAVLGAAVVMLVMIMADLLWERRVALVAGALAAVSPSLVIASTSLMTEALALPLALATVVAALLYRRTARPRWLMVSGVTLGLAVLSRPVLAVLGVTVVALVWPAERSTSLRRWLGPAVSTVAVAALTVAPWVVRNRLVMHTWAISTEQGFVASGTYNHSSYSDKRLPAAWRPPNLDPTLSALIRAHPRANEVETNRRLEHAVTNFIGEHPSYVAKVLVFNTARLLDLGGLSYTRDAVASEYGYPADRFGTAEIVGCWLVLSLAAVGVVTRRGRTVPWGYWSAPLLLWIAMAPLEILPRYRAVIDPFVVPLAAVGLLSALTLITRSGLAPASGNE